VTTQSTSLRPGLRLASQVCSTEIIVVRSGTQPLTLLCGGVPMQERGAAGASKVSRDDGQMRGSLLGKRYTHPEDPAFEVLVTAAGDGTLSADGKELVLKEAKPLPASDLRPTPTSAWRDSVRRQRGSAVSEGPLR
jgi:hypothetical protein